MVRRERLVFLEPGGGPDARTDEVLARVEARAAELGYVFSVGLFAALNVTPPRELAGLGDDLLEHLAHERGAHVAHVPLFRNFPDSTPRGHVRALPASARSRTCSRAPSSRA